MASLVVRLFIHQPLQGTFFVIFFLLKEVPAVRCFDSGYVGKQPVAWNEYCAEYWLKELQESMDMCTGLCEITEILLKMALNT